MITDTINKATATVVVMPYTVTYDGNPQTATVSSLHLVRQRILREGTQWGGWQRIEHEPE